MKCLMQAWDNHEVELLGWLIKRLGNQADAEDMLQSLFLKAIRQQSKFCELENARAWLFKVARNALADRLRLQKEQIELPDNLVANTSPPEAVTTLAECLPGVIKTLSEDDRDIITQCDLDGSTQKDYAKRKGISLSGTKSRLQRARKRLQKQLSHACQVRYDENGHVCCFIACSEASNKI
ncbi:hypothetical protein MNBD_GAMMA10-1390 [hydrothermal vent metagenome]|uniref:RNA polymerase sigma factor SigZ n=1 Tax=hydrothermal vent metagenome TaxID=652676 RepID=A0A3B0X7A0_9ZZZZ